MRNKTLITGLKERNVPFCLTHQFIMCLKPKETSSDRKCVLDIFFKTDKSNSMPSRNMEFHVLWIVSFI